MCNLSGVEYAATPATTASKNLGGCDVRCIKKTQKTPPDDLDLARRRMKEMQA
jgi:hypothetical protein